ESLLPSIEGRGIPFLDGTFELIVSFFTQRGKFDAAVFMLKSISGLFSDTIRLESLIGISKQLSRDLVYQVLEFSRKTIDPELHDRITREMVVRLVDLGCVDDALAEAEKISTAQHRVILYWNLSAKKQLGEDAQKFYRKAMQLLLEQNDPIIIAN